MLRSALPSLLAAAVLWAACTRASPAPGEPLGTFHFQAAALTIGNTECQFREVPDGGFEFTGSFSAVDGGPTAYFTANDKTRVGTFDGQRFESVYPGPTDDPVSRTFEVDAGCGNRFLVQETLRAVFLTAAQLVPSSSRCQQDPEAFYDAGGTVDPDAGIFRPTLGPEGYDAVGACGVLIEYIQPANPCDFPACTLVYRIDGTRTQ